MKSSILSFIIFVCAAALILGVVAVVTFFSGGVSSGIPVFQPTPAPASTPLALPQESLVQAGYGWSADQNEVAAAKEAVESMQAQMQEDHPDWMMVFSSIDYDEQAVMDALRNEVGPDTKIVGITSWQGVMTSDNWHTGPALAVLGISSSEITFGVGVTRIAEGEGRQAGQEAVRLAMQDADKAETDAPKIILINGTIGQEEDILKGIGDVAGADVPVLGATAGDNDLTGEWRQYGNGQAYPDALLVTAIYTDLKVGYMFSSGLGYLRTDKQGKVTRAEGRTIYEIDNRPAADVYNEWLGGEIDDELTNEETNIIQRGILDPLAVAVAGDTGITYYLTVHPIFINFPERSLTSVAVIEEGQTISIMRGSAEAHALRPPLVIRQARAIGEIEENEVAAGIVLSCACTHMVLGDEGVQNIIPAMSAAFGGAPFIGAFTFGEQGPVPGVGNRHQNLIQNVLIFGKR